MYFNAQTVKVPSSTYNQNYNLILHVYKNGCYIGVGNSVIRIGFKICEHETIDCNYLLNLVEFIIYLKLLIFLSELISSVHTCKL